MSTVKLTMDGQQIEAGAGTTILEAARKAGIYIPSLCSHPELPPWDGRKTMSAIYQGNRKIENAKPGEMGQGCGLCLVEVKGEGAWVRSCATEVKDGMVVVTENEDIKKTRQANLIPILSRHRHACLTCAQREGCSRTQCTSNVPEKERCCPRFGYCELQDVAAYVGISPDTPKWIPTDIPVLNNHALFTRDYNLCIGCTRCVRACRELRGVEAIGFVYDERGEIQVGSIAPTLEESGCKYCTACVEVCPTGALMDKNVRPGKKEEDIVPCKAACPAHVDIPGYLRLLAEGKRDEANAVIREKVPFPGILGRVCLHPCEAACRRGEVNEPVSICALKRYAADGDRGLWKKTHRVEEETGKKVAVVGAGPSGLTAAFYLRKKGYGVTIFEGRSKAGGMMRYGIPRYRLPGDLLEKEINEIFALGVDFKPRQSVGKDISLEQLKGEGYDAVFLGVGAQLSRKIPLEGSDHPDVLWGIDFLSAVEEGKKVTLKDNVIVIGGGRVALDVALTAMRTGAKGVTMACLEKREEMPAYRWEVDGMLEEGVSLMNSWGPRRILSEKGKLKGIEMVHCVSVFDAQGEFNPSFDDTLETVEGDQVILAIGQVSDLSFLEEDGAVKVNRGFIVVDEETQETGMKGVYAGGDAAAAPWTVIHAIASGRRAATSIDKALGGSGEIGEVLFERGDPDQYIGRDEGFAGWARERVPEIDAAVRLQDFQEVALGYSDDQAVKEARRCLQCDLRLYLESHSSPPEKILPFKEETVALVPEGEGVFQLYDEEKNIIAIRGTSTLRKTLLKALEDDKGAVYFDYEEDKMYSKRESEKLQRHLQEHGTMPGGEDDGDLF